MKFKIIDTMELVDGEWRKRRLPTFFVYGWNAWNTCRNHCSCPVIPSLWKASHAAIFSVETYNMKVPARRGRKTCKVTLNKSKG